VPSSSAASCDDGKHKGRLFRELLGVTLDNAGLLIDALSDAAATGEALPGKLGGLLRRYERKAA